MAITFNRSAVAVEPAGPGVLRQRLLVDERIPGTNVVLEHLTLQANATIFLEPSATSVIWFHLLQGEAKLDTLWTNEMSSTRFGLSSSGLQWLPLDRERRQSALC